MCIRDSGHLALDKALYRDPAELERWQASDPIRRAAQWLVSRGVSPAALQEEHQSATARIASVVAAAEVAPWPDEKMFYEDVQDVGATA